MDLVMFKWFDELNNESQCYFLKTEDCDLDIEEWKRVGYKPIGSKIRYESYSFRLPPTEEILKFLSCWYMNNRTGYLNRKDMEEICDLWDILSLKLPGPMMKIEKLCFLKQLQNLNQEHVYRMLGKIDDYLLDIFVECYTDFIGR